MLEITIDPQVERIVVTLANLLGVTRPLAILVKLNGRLRSEHEYQLPAYATRDNKNESIHRRAQKDEPSMMHMAIHTADEMTKAKITEPLGTTPISTAFLRAQYLLGKNEIIPVNGICIFDAEAKGRKPSSEQYKQPIHSQNKKKTKKWWLLCPTQLAIHGQWWSIFSTHLRTVTWSEKPTVR